MEDRDTDSIVAEVKQSLETTEFERLQQFLRSHRDEVVKDFLEHEKVRRRHVYSIPSRHRAPHSGAKFASSEESGVSKETGRDPRAKFSVKINNSSSSGSAIVVPCVERIASHTLCIPVQSLCNAEDVTDLLFVPPLDNTGRDMADILSEHDTAHRERLLELGAECQQERTNAMIDQVLMNVFQNRPLRLDTAWASIKLQEIADSMGETVDRIKTRAEHVAASISSSSADPNSTQETQTKSTTEFEETLASCRDMWCRRCYRYDCSLHGQREKPRVETQLELALKKENDGFWKKYDAAPRMRPDNDEQFAHVSELSQAQKSMCFTIYSIFDGDVSLMSSVVRAPAAVIQKYIDSHGVTGIAPTSFNHRTLEKKSKLPYYSVKNYKPNWYERYRDAPIFPHFFPCYHDERCSDENCTCVQNRFFCTLACGWGRESRNFFRGCACKAACRTTSCTCVALKRECDPDLCKCSGCSDVSGHPTLTKECHNCNILMGRGPHLLIGMSSISGWGLFTKRALKKGDYVGEYVGEAISQGEADRRGKLADAKKCR
jgi:hypothetical protein